MTKQSQDQKVGILVYFATKYCPSFLLFHVLLLKSSINWLNYLFSLDIFQIFSNQ